MALAFEDLSVLAATEPGRLSVGQVRVLSRIASSQELSIVAEEALNQQPPNVKMATLVAGLCIGKLDHEEVPGYRHSLTDGRETLGSARERLAHVVSSVVPAVDDVPRDAIRAGVVRQQR